MSKDGQAARYTKQELEAILNCEENTICDGCVMKVSEKPCQNAESIAKFALSLLDELSRLSNPHESDNGPIHKESGMTYKEWEQSEGCVE